jgi:hypothetical protein
MFRVFKRSQSKRQKVNLCRPLLQDFHSHAKTGLASDVPLSCEYALLAVNILVPQVYVQ